MSGKIIIASDSTTDLSAELIERYGIKTLPIGITLGTEIYKDGVDIDADKIYEHHEKTGELPKTNAPNVADFEEFFAELTKDGDSVVYFSLSSTMSSAYSNACLVAEDFENVYVIDTKNLSTGGGLLALSACDMVANGLDAKTIAEKSKKLCENVEASFVIDSLLYLHKGGRCPAIAVLGANLLKLKPCIEVKNGSMGMGKKYRGNFQNVLREYINERLVNTDDIDKTRVFVTHAGCDLELVKELAKTVTDTKIFDEVLITRAGCTISSHCGRNTLGILFMRKSPVK
ncbi:MAG: DegV family protein [Clostridia bacterium]|nr:DegV family protein [Clostridia bacterium]